MPDLDPRIHGAPPVPAASSQEHAERRPAPPESGQEGTGDATGHGDRAELSPAARIRLVRGELSPEQVVDPVALAEDTVASMQSSIGVAGSVHTAAVFRAARLIR